MISDGEKDAWEKLWKPSNRSPRPGTTCGETAMSCEKYREALIDAAAAGGASEGGLDGAKFFDGKTDRDFEELLFVL
jgi:hypothetical protein